MIGKPRDKLIDYLTPMRYQREYLEDLKGKNEVDIQDQKRRARLKKDQSKSSQSVFLGHLMTRGRIRENSEKPSKMQQKDQEPS